MSQSTSPRQALAGFVTLLRDQPKLPLALLGFLMLLAGLTEGIGILLLAPLINLLAVGGGSDNALIRLVEEALTSLGVPLTAEGLLLAFIVLVLFRATLVFARDILAQRIQLKLVDGLRHQAFSALLGAEWSLVHGDRSSDFANLLITDLSRIGHGLHVSLNLLAGLTVMGAYALVATGLSPSMTGIALASGALLFVLLSGHRRSALRLGHELGVSNRAVHGNVQETLGGLKLAKILGNEQRHLDEFDKVVADLRQRQVRFSITNGLTRSVFTIGGALFTAGYLYLGLKLLDIPVAELLTLVVIFARLIPQWSMVQQQLIQLLHAAPALIESRQLQQRCLDAREPAVPVESPRRAIHQALRVEQLSYSYGGRDQLALNGLDLTLPAHTTTAVIGPSGSGKSTLADLLMGLLEPTQGRILVDDVEICGGERIAWRRSVAYVPQETFLFADSVRQNLLLARPDAGETDLRQALGRAAADFVFELPGGLDTLVGERGVKLSGGERQRIALARALLCEPSLLILDEATSALDIENEERVRRAIEQLHGDLTVLVIGHRLSTLRHADQVLVLDQGKMMVCAPWQEAEQALAEHGRDLLIAAAGARND